LTYSPTSVGQAWVWDVYGSGGSCSYECLNGYTGTGCTTPPPSYNPPINGVCGTAEGTYGYSATSFYGTFCSVGTVNPSTPSFPSAGSGTTWTCEGSYSGTTDNCTANRQDNANSCATPPPSGGNYGALTYSPTSVGQAWEYNTNSCGYLCTNGYTGSGCSTVPVVATGTGSEVGFWSSFINPFTLFFSKITEFLGKILDFPIREAPYGMTFSGSLSPVTIGIGDTIGCGLTNSTQKSSYEWTGRDCYSGDMSV